MNEIQTIVKRHLAVVENFSSIKYTFVKIYFYNTRFIKYSLYLLKNKITLKLHRLNRCRSHTISPDVKYPITPSVILYCVYLFY